MNEVCECTKHIAVPCLLDCKLQLKTLFFRHPCKVLSKPLRCQGAGGPKRQRLALEQKFDQNIILKL